MTEQFALGSRQWLSVAFALLVLTSITLLWSTLRSRELAPWVWLSGLLKLVAVASLAAYLVEPMLRSTRPVAGANALAIAVDNSRSMEIRSAGESESPSDKLKKVLAADTPWQVRAAQDFSVRRYAFDKQLRAIESFAELDFQGQSSAIGDSIETLADRFSNRPNVGLLLFTDGNSTDSLPSDWVPNGKMPLYPVVDRGRGTIHDIAVTDPTAFVSAFEIAPVRVEATISAQKLAGKTIVARLLNESGETLDKQVMKIEGEPYRERVRFQYKPEKTGIQFVKVRAHLESEDKENEADPKSDLEVTTANNSRLIAVDRGGGPYRVLYIAGRPNWEFKFLKRALDEDSELECVGLIRIAKKEAKFAFRDREVDSTNPLFAGFENADQEATEQYDETIYLPIGVEDQTELKAGFPQSEESLFAYDALILDDIEAKFFSHAQMLLLRQFVADRGGGLLMLGGLDSYEKGGYAGTPLGDLLPISLSSRSQSDSEPNPVSYRLTREGALEPWMRLRGSEADEARRLAQMPKFLTWSSIGEAKPGASILAQIASESGSSRPGVVTQPFGSGRTAALVVGDMWRWGMRRPNESNDDLAQTWRQMVRWLTSDVPRRVEAEAIAPTRIGEPVDLRIVVRDEKYLALDNAVIQVNVLQPDGKLVVASVEPDRKTPGVYHAKFWSTLDGPYVASITADAPDGSRISECEIGWTAEPSSEEFRSLSSDLSQLRELAEQSGGELVDLENLGAFIKSLPNRKVPITQEKLEPLWHRTSWLLLTIICLCGEWGLRRMRGLA